MRMEDLHIGTAGWQLPKALNDTTRKGSHLERYADLFNAVEINSTFYRPHQVKTFERWAASVPKEFRFAVKMHRAITHEQRLRTITPAQHFLEMVDALGEKLGPVLVPLPPSLAWSMEAEDFLHALREVFEGAVVLEARHPSWSLPEAQRVLLHGRISGVAADPPLITDALMPMGDLSLRYFRLHGSPRVYWSSYSDAFLNELATRIVEILRADQAVWTIFDNTAAGAGASDALRLQRMVKDLL